jgi:hypothetical protein
MTNQRTSQAGNLYYDVTLLAKLRVTINGRWKAAQEHAKATDTKNKEPSFVLQVVDDKGTTQHSGKGAAWMFIRKEGKVHQGNMIINDVSYLVDIRREDSEFVLQLTPREEISLSSL